MRTSGRYDRWLVPPIPEPNADLATMIVLGNVRDSGCDKARNCDIWKYMERDSRAKRRSVVLVVVRGERGERGERWQKSIEVRLRQRNPRGANSHRGNVKGHIYDHVVRLLPVAMPR